VSGTHEATKTMTVGGLTFDVTRATDFIDVMHGFWLNARDNPGWASNRGLVISSFEHNGWKVDAPFGTRHLTVAEMAAMTEEAIDKLAEWLKYKRPSSYPEKLT
jgi:hypothetical protein